MGQLVNLNNIFIIVKIHVLRTWIFTYRSLILTFFLIFPDTLHTTVSFLNPRRQYQHNSLMSMHNPLHPGEILKELIINPLDITITDASVHLNVSRKHRGKLHKPL